MLFGSAALTTIAVLAETPGHRGHLPDHVISWGKGLVVFAVLTPLFLGFLLLWDFAARRFSALESIAVVRLFGLVAFAAIVAATLLIVITASLTLWLAIRDHESFSNLWQNPFELRQLFVILLASTSAWAILPRLLFKLPAVERHHSTTSVIAR